MAYSDHLRQVVVGVDDDGVHGDACGLVKRRLGDRVVLQHVRVAVADEHQDLLNTPGVAHARTAKLVVA